MSSDSVDSRPDWADGEVLRVCRPELIDSCDWPTCDRSAVCEIEVSVDGSWEAHRICEHHRAVLGVTVEST